MSKKVLSSLIFLVLLLSACKRGPEQTDTDNIYKFREYISYNTYGEQSIGTEISVVLTQALEQYELNQELPADYFEISPKVEGTWTITDTKTLLFTPAEKLSANTEYSVSVHLKKLYSALPKEFGTYTFAFKTFAPEFKINTGHVQSYSKKWQYIKGSLEAIDIVSAKEIPSVLEAHFNGKALSIKWEEVSNDAQFFNFTIDSIPRQIEDQELTVNWDGTSLGAENSGSEKILIPGQNKFVVIDAKTSTAPSAMLALNFSEPLDPKQNFNGLVTIEKAEELRYELSGNVLNVYPSNTLTGQVRVTVHNGLKSAEGIKLNVEFSELVSFEALKPQVRLISKGTILPNAKSTPIYFETVNLSAVEVRVIQVYQDNILQHLQQNNIDQGYQYNLRLVGRRVAFKVIDLKNDHGGGQWQAHALNLSELITPNPGALYRIEFSFKKEHSMYACDQVTDNSTNEEEYDEYEEYYEEEYTENGTREEEELREELFWDNQINDWRSYNYNWRERNNPCHPAYYNQEKTAFTHLLGSDLGLIVKKGNNQSYQIFATNLLTAQPETNTTIKLYNFQRQLMAELTTDPDGKAIYDANSHVFFVVGQKGNNYAYAKLGDGNALSMSKFDVAGQELQRGLQGLLYAERGVHRPGDTIHLTFVLNDKNNPLPKNHPVVLEVTDARGKLIQRTSSTQAAIHEMRHEGNFYYFPIPTSPEAPTGNYNAKILVGGAKFGKTLKVATVKPNRLKINLDFDDKILSATKNITGKAQVNWLHGSPARQLKMEMSVELKNTRAAFSKYKNYDFQDPVRQFNEMEMEFFNGTLSEEGTTNFNQKIKLGSKAPGMIQAVFTTKVFEEGGDFSIDVHSQNLAPYDHFVGVAAPKPHQYGSYLTDEKVSFDLVTLDAEGNTVAKREITVQLFKVEWRWWWNRGRDNLSRYENSQVHRPMQEFTVTSDNSGKTHFNIEVPDEEGGRYLVRAIDKKSGHATGLTTYFYKNWWSRPAGNDNESAKILLFSTDKDKYQKGEEATITFPSSLGGRALVSIENGSEVLSTQWVTTAQNETVVKIPVTGLMAPNVFVNISLLQPHGSVKNDLPIRMYGVVPIKVEDPATQLQPKLKMPDVLKPEESFTVKVSEASKKPMTYTIAVVDEGLLDLTRYTTPNIHGAFYAKQALGVKTFDIYDDVMGSYSVSVGNIYAIGGGDLAQGSKNRKAQRFKPVVTYLGPFELAAGKIATHTIDMPNYVGSVKTMVVAGNNESAYGHTDKSTPVRKPLMVLASIPRKLSPGEKVTIPVTVFAMEEKVKNASIQIKTGNALKPLGNTSQNIHFDKIGEQMAYFDFEVLPNSEVQKIEVMAQGAGETARYTIEIDVENPNPFVTQSHLHNLDGKAEKTIDFETFGTVGTNSTLIELSTLPPMDLTGRMEYLMRYPHGCIEQVTSSVFPQLYLADIMDLTFQQKKEAEENIKAAIKKIGDRQSPLGGLPYWPGAYSDDEWGSTYAGHFMIEAKSKGYALPLTFLSNWLRYQRKAARQWNNHQTAYNNDHLQAYRLYTLAMAGEPELSAMNRLRESKNLSNNAKWRLAGAYALLGKNDVAREIARSANIDFQPHSYDYRTYGSVFRNRAMALETMVLLKDDQQKSLAESLARNLNGQRWYSTQETSFALLSLSKMVVQNGGKDLSVTLNGEAIKTEKAMAQRKVNTKIGQNQISITNNGSNLVYVNVVQRGKLALGKEITQQKGLSISSKFMGTDGKTLSVSELRQGTEITAQVMVYNNTADWVGNIALTQIFPSGWEIVNTSFTDAGSSNTANVDYEDIRDDRVKYYFDLSGRQSKLFTIKLNASFMGAYYLPGAQAEAMYDNNYFARNQGQQVKVVK